MLFSPLAFLVFFFKVCYIGLFLASYFAEYFSELYFILYTTVACQFKSLFALESGSAL